MTVNSVFNCYICVISLGAQIKIGNNLKRYGIPYAENIQTHGVIHSVLKLTCCQEDLPFGNLKVVIGVEAMMQAMVMIVTKTMTNVAVKGP